MLLYHISGSQIVRSLFTGQVDINDLVVDGSSMSIRRCYYPCYTSFNFCCAYYTKNFINSELFCSVSKCFSLLDSRLSSRLLRLFVSKGDSDGSSSSSSTSDYLVLIIFLMTESSSSAVTVLVIYAKVSKMTVAVQNNMNSVTNSDTTSRNRTYQLS